MTIGDYITRVLLSSKKFNETTNSTLCILIQNKFDLEKKPSPVQIRKIISELRQDGLPIISNSRGYYISYNEEEIHETYVSLMNRANSIIRAANGLKKVEIIK